MFVNAVIFESFVDGPGVRSVIFFQGCPHNCVGCHNPGTHDYESPVMSIVSVSQFMKEFSRNPYLSGVTFSGGEPFSERNLVELGLIADEVHSMGKTVWAYTGYTLPMLIRYLDSLPRMSLSESNAEVVLRGIDVLVDGPFCEGLRDLGLTFRGSSNQRLIDMSCFLSAYTVGMSNSELDELANASLCMG